MNLAIKRRLRLPDAYLVEYGDLVMHRAVFVDREAAMKQAVALRGKTIPLFKESHDADVHAVCEWFKTQPRVPATVAFEPGPSQDLAIAMQWAAEQTVMSGVGVD